MRTSNAKTPPDVAASNARDRVPAYWMWLVLLRLSLCSSPLWAVARDWAPPHVKATGQADGPLLKLGVLDVTLYNGWEGHAVDPTGEKDSTKALQKAIEDARDSALVVFFPSGTYQVSDTLNCMKRAWWHGSRRVWANWEHEHVNVLVGSTKGSRPVLRLVDRCPGFADPSNPRAAVHVWNQAKSGETEADPAPPPTSERVNATALGEACGFNQSVRGLEIDLGRGNTGAVGVCFAGAQGSTIEDVKVMARDGFAGFWNLPGRAMGAANIEVEGGRYGIYIPSGCPSPVVAGAVLRHQSDGAIAFSGWTPLTLVGFRIEKETAPALRVERGWRGIGGTLVMVDGSIEFARGSGPAVDNSLGKTIYLRNVWLAGASHAVRSRAQLVGACSGPWSRVSEYSHCDSTPQHGEASQSLIEGKLTQEEVVAVQTNAGEPPPDVLRQHVWDRLPSFEDADAKSVRDSDIGAKGDGVADDTDALQKAINTHAKVFLPKGTYRISRTLILRAETKLFGLTKAHTTIVTADTWRPTSETPMLMTVDDAGASTYLADLNLDFNTSDLAHDYFNLVTWRAGRHSIVKSVEGRQMNAWDQRDEQTTPHRLFLITGHGGGRWYFWPQHSTLRYRNRNPGFRLMAIIGTSEPLSFYGLNPEHAQTDAHVEINGAQNIRVFAVKVENRLCGVMQILDSRNVMVVGHGGHSVMADGVAAFRVANSTDVVLAVLGSSKYNPKGCMVREQGIETEARCLAQTGVVALYKRGEFQDAPWRSGSRK